MRKTGTRIILFRFIDRIRGFETLSISGGSQPSLAFELPLIGTAGSHPLNAVVRLHAFYVAIKRGPCLTGDAS